METPVEYCAYCTPNTNGHEPDCPLHPDNSITKYNLRPIFVQYGWICPKCGAVYGPHVSECSRCCPAIRITCNVTGVAGVTWEGANEAKDCQ